MLRDLGDQVIKEIVFVSRLRLLCRVGRDGLRRHYGPTDRHRSAGCVDEAEGVEAVEGGVYETGSDLAFLNQGERTGGFGMSSRNAFFWIASARSEGSNCLCRAPSSPVPECCLAALFGPRRQAEGQSMPHRGTAEMAFRWRARSGQPPGGCLNRWADIAAPPAVEPAVTQIPMVAGRRC
jgi:hypothetical protein